MKTTLRLALIAATLATATLARADTPPSAITTITQNFRTFCLGPTPPHDPSVDDADLPKTSPATIHHLLTTQKPDGSWPDIDYANDDRSSWPAAGHMARILTLTLALRRNETTAADAPALLPAIHHALAFWQAHDFICPNWWFNQIGIPKTVGTAAVLLDTDLTPAERDFLTSTILARSTVGAMTGQNRVWLAGNGLLRAMLTHDDTLAAQASKIIADEIVVTTDEGIQPDWSFHQHGPQQQFGNYGRAFASELTHWAVILHNSADAIPQQKLDILSHYLLDGEAWTIWRGVMDISACGRQLAPHSPISKAAGLTPIFTTWETLDPAHAADFHTFVQRNADHAVNDLLGTRYFYRSDYLVHRTPTLAVTLKMHSDRVLGGETVNSENLSGNHLADGALFLYQTGQEYTDIFPCWDWRMIPGITAAQDDSPLTWLANSKQEKRPAAPKEPAPKSDVGTPPKSVFAKPKGTDFVGGVQDNTHAVAAMDFARDTLHAHKAWFFDGDSTLCLGAAITSTSDAPVVTTVNQCLDRGKTLIDGQDFFPGRVYQGPANTIDHDGLRYTILDPRSNEVNQPGSPDLRLESVTGNWSRVFRTAATPKADVKENLFTLTIQHGVKPTNATYAYEICPTATPVDPADILSNTSTLQAIHHKDWIGAIFWQPAMLTAGAYHLAADHPCILILDTRATPPHLAVAEPTQKLRNLTVTVNDRAIPIPLPTGDAAGATIIAPVP